jgi:gamma-glutamyltranspeptidase/glutathione hydrolase
MTDSLPGIHWDNPYPTVRRPTLARAAVSTSQPVAAQAGIRMLLQGGNAMDAALATAIALTVTEPISNGIGSDAFAIVWDGQQLHGLNASGRAPAGWTPARFGAARAMPQRGWDTVTVPGAVSAWVALSKRFGRLPFGELFKPAIEYAEQGFVVTPFIGSRWEALAPELKDQPGFAEAYLPGGRTPRVGELFALPAQARSLEQIARTCGEAFYRGALAAAIARCSQAHNAALTEADLAAHQPEWVTPIRMDYRGYTVHEIPPNTQGIVCLMALGMLKQMDLARHPVDSAASVHLQIEAVKLALADAAAHIGEPATMALRAEALLDPDYLAGRARLIDPSRAQDFGHGAPPRGGTVYLTAADAQGMMVSMIQSNFNGFGSGVVVPGTGISLQNRGSGFVLTPGHPNQVAPGKRPFHTIIPGFVTRNGVPVMTLGLMGGTMQAQGHTQVMVRIADYGQNPQAAIDAPRFRIVQGLEVNCESSFGPATLQGLEQLGHRIVSLPPGYMDFGCAQIIHRTEGGYLAASDARRDSLAIGL